MLGSGATKEIAPAPAPRVEQPPPPPSRVERPVIVDEPKPAPQLAPVATPQPAPVTVAQPAPVAPKPRAASKPRDAAKPRDVARQAEPAAAVAPTPAPVADGPLDNAALVARYKSVGAELKTLVQTKGAEAASGLQSQYRLIIITDAMSSPDKRADAAARLARIHAAIAKLR
jgi:hypothetical protein